MDINQVSNLALPSESEMGFTIAQHQLHSVAWNQLNAKRDRTKSVYVWSLPLRNIFRIEHDFDEDVKVFHLLINPVKFQPLRNYVAGLVLKLGPIYIFSPLMKTESVKIENNAVYTVESAGLIHKDCARAFSGAKLIEINGQDPLSISQSIMVQSTAHLNKLANEEQ